MRQKGVIHIAAIILVGVVVILVAAAWAYYSLSAKKAAYNQALPSSAPVSESDETSTIEEEINATNEGSIEADLQELDSSASSL